MLGVCVLRAAGDVAQRAEVQQGRVPARERGAAVPRALHGGAAAVHGAATGGAPWASWRSCRRSRTCPSPRSSPRSRARWRCARARLIRPPPPPPPPQLLPGAALRLIWHLKNAATRSCQANLLLGMLTLFSCPTMRGARTMRARQRVCGGWSSPAAPSHAGTPRALSGRV